MQEHFMVLRVLLTIESGRKAQYYFFFFMKWIFIFNLITFTRKKIHDHYKNFNNI